MAAPEVTALLKRGRRTVATHFKSECFRKSGSNKSLNEFMNYLFDPRHKSIDDVDVLDWCRWLIAGGVTFDEFSKTGVHHNIKQLWLICLTYKASIE